MFCMCAELKASMGWNNVVLWLCKDNDIKKQREYHSSILKWKCILTLSFKYIWFFFFVFFISIWRLYFYFMLVWHTLNYRKSYSVFISVADLDNVWVVGIYSCCVPCKWLCECGLLLISPKLTAVQVLVLLWGQIKADDFPSREWVSRLPDGWERCGVVVRNRAVLITSIEAWDCKSFLALNWIWKA